MSTSPDQSQTQSNSTVVSVTDMESIPVYHSLATLFSAQQHEKAMNITTTYLVNILRQAIALSTISEKYYSCLDRKFQTNQENLDVVEKVFSKICNIWKKANFANTQVKMAKNNSNTVKDFAEHVVNVFEKQSELESIYTGVTTSSDNSAISGNNIGIPDTKVDDFTCNVNMITDIVDNSSTSVDTTSITILKQQLLMHCETIDKIVSEINQKLKNVDTYRQKVAEKIRSMKAEMATNNINIAVGGGSNTIPEQSNDITHKLTLPKINATIPEISNYSDNVAKFAETGAVAVAVSVE
jgi:ribosomal protein S17E